MIDQRSASMAAVATRPRFWQPIDIEQSSLAAMIGRVATGDQSAFAAMYDELSPMVFGIAKRVVRDETHAQEITQEVFVDVWRLAGRFDASKGNVRSWAATIAHRRAVDRVRSEQAHRERNRADALVGQPATSGPDELAVDREAKRRAVTALRQLSDPQREALELAYYGGLTHVEIADHLGIALGTAKTRIRDGLLRLRSALGEEVTT
jgi:RNA polymerase sigma-70 factor (ECF subfamily)